MGAGLFIDKEAEKTNVGCLVMDYGERLLRQKDICSFFKGIPDRPVCFKMENLYGMSNFKSSFQFDDFVNEASYSAFGTSGRVFIGFGHGFDCIKVFNMFPVGMITKDSGDAAPGRLVDNVDEFGAILVQDRAVARAKDKYAQDLFFASKEILIDIRKTAVSYSEALQQEYVARKKFAKEAARLNSKLIKTSGMKKAVAKLRQEVSQKCYDRRNIGLALNAKMKLVHEAYFACDMLSKTSLGAYSEMTGKMSKDFKNLIILDVVRRRALGNDVPGGPKMMIAVESAAKMNKHCRRLNSFLSYSGKAFNGFNELYVSRLNAGSTSINIDKEKGKRYINILRMLHSKVNSSYPAPEFYKAQYLYYLKKLNKGEIIKFNDNMIVQRMMKAGYSDGAITEALTTASFENVGRPRGEMTAIITNCRVRYNSEMERLRKAAQKNAQKDASKKQYTADKQNAQNNKQTPSL